MKGAKTVIKTHFVSSTKYFVLQVVIYIIVSAACGGLSWPTCIKK